MTMTSTENGDRVRDPAGTVPPAGALRCSTADRERTAAALHRAAGEGRLTLAETEERLGQAYATRYEHELAAVTADLPATDPAGPAGWALVWTALRRQLADETALLAGRVPAERARRLRAGLTLLVPLLLVALGLALALHGLVADGPDHDTWHHGAGVVVPGRVAT